MTASCYVPSRGYLRQVLCVSPLETGRFCDTGVTQLVEGRGRGRVGTGQTGHTLGCQFHTQLLSGRMGGCVDG